MPESKATIRKVPSLIVTEYGSFVAESNQFALSTFTSKLNLQQQRIYIWTMAMIKVDEPINAIATYTISLEDMAGMIGVSLKGLRQNIKPVIEEMRKLNTKYTPPTYYDTPDKHIVDQSFGIFDRVYIDANNPNMLNVRLVPSFRENVIRMKAHYDIEFPLHTYMRLGTSYAVNLYSYLMGMVSTQRAKEMEERKLSSYYTIEIPKDNLFSIINYSGTVGNFNRSILPNIMKSLHETQLMFESGDPEIIHQGRSVRAYVFHLRVHTTAKEPIFRRSLLDYSIDNGLPTMEYLLRKLSESIGVGKGFLASVRLDNDRAKVWTTYLYTLYKTADDSRYDAKYGRAKYFNKCYKEDVVAQMGLHPAFMFDCFLAASKDSAALHAYWKDDDVINRMRDNLINTEKPHDVNFLDMLENKIAIAREKGRYKLAN